MYRRIRMRRSCQAVDHLPFSQEYAIRGALLGSEDGILHHAPNRRDRCHQPQRLLDRAAQKLKRRPIDDLLVPQQRLHPATPLHPVRNLPAQTRQGTRVLGQLDNAPRRSGRGVCLRRKHVGEEEGGDIPCCGSVLARKVEYGSDDGGDLFVRRQGFGFGSSVVGDVPIFQDIKAPFPVLDGVSTHPRGEFAREFGEFAVEFRECGKKRVGGERGAHHGCEG